MPVSVETRSVCDVCGKTDVRDGAHGGHPPAGWATLQMQYRSDEAMAHRWGERIERTLCGECADRVEAVVARGGTP